MDAPARYLEELRSELSAYPTWLPTDVIEVGSFGRIVDGRFVTAGRLADLDIPSELTESQLGQAFKKQRGMKLTTGASSGAFDVGVDVKFEATSAYAWTFAARGVRKSELKNIYEVNRMVLEAFKAGQWERPWGLVTAVWHVERLAVLVARSKQVIASIHAKGTLTEPIDVLLEESATFRYESDDFFCVPGAKAVTPLYGLHKLQGWLGKDLRGISDGGDLSAPSLEISNAEPFFDHPP